MTDKELYQLRYPIGEFKTPETITKALISGWIDSIALFPKRVTFTIKDLPNKAFDYKYRPEGWTVRQVIHHCADSHINNLSSIIKTSKFD